MIVGTGTDVSDAAVDRATSGAAARRATGGAAGGSGGVVAGRGGAAPGRADAPPGRRISDQDLGRRLAVPATRDEIAALGATMNAPAGPAAGGAGPRARVRRRRRPRAAHPAGDPAHRARAGRPVRAAAGRRWSRRSPRPGEETDRLIRLAEDLLLLARADNRQPFLRAGAACPCPPCWHAAARGAGARAPSRGVTVAVDAPRPSSTSTADPDRLRQAVDNLLDNATRHAPPGSTCRGHRQPSRHGLVAIDGRRPRRRASRRTSCPRPSSGSAAPRPPAPATTAGPVWAWRSCGPSPRRTAAARPRQTARRWRDRHPRTTHPCGVDPPVRYRKRHEGEGDVRDGVKAGGKPTSEDGGHPSRSHRALIIGEYRRRR